MASYVDSICAGCGVVLLGPSSYVCRAFLACKSHLLFVQMSVLEKGNLPVLPVLAVDQTKTTVFKANVIPLWGF